MRQIVIARRMDDGVCTPFESGKLHYPAAGPRASARSSLANTTIRCAAEYSGWQADSTSRSKPTRSVTSVAVGATIRSALDAVGEPPVRHVELDPVAGVAGRRRRGTARRRSCGGRRSPRCRAGRAAAWPGSGRARGAGRRRPCPRRTPPRRRSPASGSARAGRPASLRRASARAANASRRLASSRRSARWSTAASGAFSIVGQLALELVLLDAPVDRRHRLLPQQRQRRVGEQQRAGHDQHRRERAQGAPHRRSADSVPPSEPGPA